MSAPTDNVTLRLSRHHAELLLKMLTDALGAPQPTARTGFDLLVDRAAGVVAEQFQVTRAALMGRCRLGFVGEARFALYLLIRENTKAGWSEITQALGRTRNTVMKGCERARDLISVDQNYARRFEECRKQFRALEGKPC